MNIKIIFLSSLIICSLNVSLAKSQSLEGDEVSSQKIQVRMEKAAPELFFDAIAAKNLNEVKRLVNEEKVDVNVKQKDYYEYRALHQIAMSNRIETEEVFKDYSKIIDFLISKGAGVNVKTKHGDTPLHIAAQSGSFPLIKRLVEAGADVNARNINGETPLHFAAGLDTRFFNNISEIINYLDEKGGLKKEVENFYRSLVDRGVYEPPLQKAIEDGNIQELERLVSLGAKVDAESRDKEKYDLFCDAIIFGHLDVLKWLEEKGAYIDVNKKLCYGGSPLYEAALRGYIDIVKYLVERGARVDDEALRGALEKNTAAIQSQKEETIKYLRSKMGQKQEGKY